MRLSILSLLVLILQAAPLCAQEMRPFEWSTSVIQRLSNTTSTNGAPLASAGQSSLDFNWDSRFAPGAAVSVDLLTAIEALISAARDSGLHVVAEVQPGVDGLAEAASAAQAGLAGFIVPADHAVEFREDVARLTEGPVRVASFAGAKSEINRLSAVVDAVIIDPPPFDAGADPEQLYLSIDPSHVTRIRTTEWSSELLPALLLVPGGIYVDGPLDETAATITSFRLRHPAVGAGKHEPLVNSVYTFRRSLDTPNLKNDVVVVLGASGRTSINVSRAFADDTLLRDAVTGRTAFVSFGMASFDADPSGVILIEELP